MHGSGCHPDASASALALSFTSTLLETICSVQETNRFLKPSHPGHSILEQGLGLLTAASSLCPPTPVAVSAWQELPRMSGEPQERLQTCTVPLLPARHPRGQGGGVCFPCTTRGGLLRQAGPCQGGSSSLPVPAGASRPNSSRSLSRAAAEAGFS